MGSDFLPQDIVRITSLKTTDKEIGVNDSMRGLVGICGMIGSQHIYAKDVYQVNGGGTVDWLWHKDSLELVARICDEPTYLVNVPDEPKGLYGHSDLEWRQLAGVKLMICDVDAGYGRLFEPGSQRYSVAARTKATAGGMSIWVPADLLCKEVHKKQNDIIERLYDAHKAQADCNDLLREYKEATGRDRPRFMGGK